MIKIVNNKTKKSMEKTSDANFKAFCLPSCFNIEENDGFITATFRNIPPLSVNSLTIDETNGDNDSIINPG